MSLHMTTSGSPWFSRTDIKFGTRIIEAGNGSPPRSRHCNTSQRSSVYSVLYAYVRMYAASRRLDITVRADAQKTAPPREAH